MGIDDGMQMIKTVIYQRFEIITVDIWEGMVDATGIEPVTLRV